MPKITPTTPGTAQTRQTQGKEIPKKLTDEKEIISAIKERTGLTTSNKRNQIPSPSIGIINHKAANTADKIADTVNDLLAPNKKSSMKKMADVASRLAQSKLPPTPTSTGQKRQISISYPCPKELIPEELPKKKQKT